MADQGFDIIFYEKQNGDCPMYEFLDGLNKEMFAKMANQLDKLEQWGNNYRSDGTRRVRDGIFELRAQNKTDITRCFFFFDENRRVVLTHGFVKKKERTPEVEVDRVMRYRGDYFARIREFDARERILDGVIPDGSGPKWRQKLDAIVAAAEKQKGEHGERKPQRNQREER